MVISCSFAPQKQDKGKTNVWLSISQTLFRNRCSTRARNMRGIGVRFSFLVSCRYAGGRGEGGTLVEASSEFHIAIASFTSPLDPKDDVQKGTHREQFLLSKILSMDF